MILSWLFGYTPAASFTWVGGTSTDYFVQANWSIAGTVRDYPGRQNFDDEILFDNSATNSSRSDDARAGSPTPPHPRSSP